MKIDPFWEALFTERNIVRDVDTTGVHHITAKAINTKYEARLMTKFDQSISLPKIFRDNGLSILPDTRSSYIIGRFNCYQPLPNTEHLRAENAEFPPELQSINAYNLTSETAAGLCAFHASILEDVLQEPVRLTVSGRATTGNFEFTIKESGIGTRQNRRPLVVKNAQLEIDGGFEGVQSFAILEAKNVAVTDFHIRQLYYPYRLWESKLTKPVVPIFMVYSNSVFTFHTFRFANSTEYNSLELLQTRKYQIVPTAIEVNDLRNAVALPLQPEIDKTAFPQADVFPRIIDILERLFASSGTLTQEEMTTNYTFDLRQTQYYTSAVRYLGLLTSALEADIGVVYALTSEGRRIMALAPRARNLWMAQRILSRRVFREAMKLYLEHGELPPTSTVYTLMQSAGIPVTGTTGPRRAQTVRGWLRWLMQLTEDV